MGRKANRDWLAVRYKRCQKEKDLVDDLRVRHELAIILELDGVASTGAAVHAANVLARRRHQIGTPVNAYESVVQNHLGLGEREFARQRTRALLDAQDAARFLVYPNRPLIGRIQAAAVRRYQRPMRVLLRYCVVEN